MAAWWYLRRAIPWVTLVGCCTAAALAAGAVHQWPSTAVALLPAMLGCCAAAAAFVFDERATAVLTVTPRARWRCRARAAVGLVPLALWSGIVLLRPGDVPLHRPSWWLMGAATVLVAVGGAGVAARLDRPTPGSTVASLVAFSVFAPLVLSSLLGWASPYPVGQLTSGVLAFWLGVAGVGLSGCALALRPS